MEKLLTDSDISNTEEYNPYAIPPDLEMCKLHEKCNSIGIVDIDDIPDVCKCCAQVEARPYPICTSSIKKNDELRKYGFGYP